MTIWRFLAEQTRRGVLVLGFMARVVTLVFFGFFLALWFQPSSPIWLVLTRTMILIGVGLLLWMGSNHYGYWAAVGLVYGGLLATGPCWFVFPAQDFGPPSVQERGAIAVLRSIQQSEARYRAQFHRYGDLLEIHVPGMQATDGSRGGLFSGNGPYRLHLVLTDTAYKLTAEPPPEQGYGCLIGCPWYRHFYGDESGLLRANRHCEPATSSSSLVR
jgi:hypothetical protein